MQLDQQHKRTNGETCVPLAQVANINNGHDMSANLRFRRLASGHSGQRQVTEDEPSASLSSTLHQQL